MPTPPAPAPHHHPDVALLLDFPNPAFEHADWHRALAQGDPETARLAFIRDLRTGPPRLDPACGMADLYRRWLDGRTLGRQGGHNLDPDQVIRQHYVGVYGIEHTFTGEIDWLFDPTADWGDNRTVEWQVQFNRHYQWMTLAERYRQTGEARYAQAFERELLSWTRQCPRPPDNGMKLPGCWRLIEVGIRAGWTWPHAFETFRHSPHVSDEALWQMVAAFHEHGIHLLHWPTKRNFKTMEANGLTHVGVLFPELRMSHTFLTTGLDRACAELERQVYPDGLQDELAPDYDVLALANLYAAVHTARRREAFGREVPRRALDRLQHMAQALTHLADPDGKLPPIHDSPASDIRGLHADFHPINPTRFPPEPWRQPGLTHFDWAGWTVMRRPDHYALFDAGPWGSGHQHADALQLLTYAHGRWLCIDPGKPVYNRSAITQTMRSSQGHNVVLADGQPHHPDPLIPVADQPFPVAHHDAGPLYVAAATRRSRTLGDNPTSFQHQRLVLDIANLGWVIYDRLTPDDDHPHHWEWLWHLGMDRAAILSDTPAVHAAYDGGPSLLLQPISQPSLAPLTPLAPTVLRAQETPTIRGWCSRKDNDQPQPCTTISFTTEPRPGPIALFTLLIPVPDNTLPPLTVAEATPAPGIAHLAFTHTNQPFTFTFHSDEDIIHLDYQFPDHPPATLTLAPHAFP